jgi:DNA polymerase-1
MEAMPCWKEKLEAPREPKEDPRTFRLPKDPAFFAERVTIVDSVSRAAAMFDLARERPLSHVGIDAEFRFGGAEIAVGSRHDKSKPDIRQIVPLLLSFSFAEPRTDGSIVLYPFVVDLWIHEVMEAVRGVLRLPLPFVGHYLKSDVFCLWKLELPAPRMLWDSWVCERVLTLGRNRWRDRVNHTDDDSAEIEEAIARENSAEELAYDLSLVATCRRYGVNHAYASRKEEMQRSFLEHPEGAPFTADQVSYAAEDSVAAAHLYIPQVQAAALKGVLQHLVQIENPWVETNAAFEWNGVKVDPERASRLSAHFSTESDSIRAELAEMGIRNPNGRNEKIEFFRRLGLLERFRRRGGISFDKDSMEANMHLHPAARLLHRLGKIESIMRDGLLDPGAAGIDGRIHPEHRQCGADTSRQTAKWPNVLGVSGDARPVVVPEPGNVLLDFDLRQIEPSLAGAIFGVPELVAATNSGDVYSAVARKFYAGELGDEGLGLDDDAFKAKHQEKRAAMKIFFLASLYGISAAGIAANLGIPESEGQELMESFARLLPNLGEAMKESARFSSLRGYAVAATGLRRYRGRTGPVTAAERRWMSNFEVQGTASVFFKAAGNRIHRLCGRYGAKLVVPLHDSFLIEVPEVHKDEVAEMASRIMRESVQEFFPELDIRVDHDPSKVGCWTKGGNLGIFGE